MTKAIRTVDMIRRIRDEHFEQLRGASAEARIAFYHNKARWLLDEVAAERQVHRPSERQPA
jgi:hypothetical protein